MKKAIVVVGCLTMVLLAACATTAPTSPQGAAETSTARPTTSPTPAETPTAEPTSPPELFAATTTESTLTPEPMSIPTRDLRDTSVEFGWEITGDPHPLHAVRGITVDQQGNLYVVDCGNGRIQKFDSEGTFLTTWGSEGTDDGEFWFWTEEAGSNAMGDVAVDAQGRVYVADAGNSRVQVFDGEGQFLGKWGEFGSGDGQFTFAQGVAVGPEGHVYVTDSARKDVQRFDSRGQLLVAWSVPDMYFGPVVAPAVDREGNVYIPAGDAKGVHKYDGEGKLLSTVGESGSGDGQFALPVVVAVDEQGNLYVADLTIHCIQKFDTDGNFLKKLGSKGTGQGEFSSPSGLAVGPDGSIYVADGSDRIQKFRQE